MTSNRSKSPMRPIRWVIFGFLGLQVLYLLVANLFLQPWAGQEWIRKRPDQFLLEWQAAWTVVPGLIHARGLHLRGRTQTQSWELKLETLRAWVVIPSLLKRHLSFMGAQGSGVSFRLARDPTQGEAKHHPIIHGFAPPIDSPKKPRRGFTMTIDGARFDEIQEIWLYHQRYTGQGHLVVSAHIKTGTSEMPGSEISIPRLELNLAQGTLALNGTETGKLESLKANLTIEPYRPKEHRGLAGLRFVSGTVALDAPHADIRFLGHLFRQVTWIDLSGEGAMQVDLRLQRGRIVPASRVHAWARVNARYLDFLIEGQARVRGAVIEPEGGSPPGTLDVTFDAFSVRQDGQEEPHAFGAGAVLHAAGNELDLAQPGLDWTVDLTLPAAEVPDLTYYNAYLPEKSSVALLAGAGRVAAELHLDLSSTQFDGTVHIDSNNVDLLFQGVQIQGDLAIDTSIQNGDPMARQFDISGTKLRIDNATIGTPHSPEKYIGWWGEVEVHSGKVALNPLALEGFLEFNLRNTAPLVQLLSKGKSRPLWLTKMLTIEDVTGHGSVVFHEEAIDLSGVDLHLGERLRFLGELRLSNDSPHLLIFCRLGKLTTALEQVGQQRAWGPIKSLRWYESRRQAWRGTNSRKYRAATSSVSRPAL